MSDVVRLTKSGSIGVITIDNPPVNALGLAVRKGLAECHAAAEADPEIKAIVLICAGRTFVAGADITEFGKPIEEPIHNTVFNKIEVANKPVIAAMHGTALGGGLELSMACHYRCAVAAAKFGQPEVNLGLIPGAGGTQRLPRLVGVELAAKMIAGGAPIDAKTALKAGLLDEIVEGDLQAGAVALAERIVKESRAPRRTRDLSEKISGVDGAVFAAARAEMNKTKRGLEAPQRGIDAVEFATKLPFDEGMAKEFDLFVNCMFSTQSAALRHVFFAERTAAKIPDVPKDTPLKAIKSAAVLGAGTMGSGITMCFANAGIPVHVLESDQEHLDKGMAGIRKTYEASVSKGKLTPDKATACLGLIRPTLDYNDLRNADLVVEAVFEEMELKKEVFGRLDTLVNSDAILATNTSTLDVNQIAAITSRPEKVIGLHFFSPANIMRLLEIVRGAKTSKETVATAMELAKTLKKVGVLVGVCDGFVGNRMFLPFMREAEFLLEEGALPQQVDKAMTDFGYAMGPFAVWDLAGLDVGWRIRKRQAPTRPKDMRYCEISDKLCEMGRFGQKTSAGYYKYDASSRTPIIDPEVEALIVRESELKKRTRRAISDEEIVERCVYSLVNEGARILEEGIALRSSDIDIIYLYGYGFPAFRGGPMFYGDTVGLDKVYATICELEGRHGKLWAPAPLLKRMAEEGKTFTYG